MHGLVLGGWPSALLLKDNLALEEEDDPGEAFTVAAVYPSLELVEPMQWLVEAIASEPVHFGAINDGLCYNDNVGLDSWIDDFLSHDEPAVRLTGVEILAYRCPPDFESRLKPLLTDADSRVSLAATSAVGFVSDLGLLKPLLDHDDPMVVSRAAQLLLETGDQETLPRLKRRLEDASTEIRREIALILGALGELSDCWTILSCMENDPEFVEIGLLALGMVGNVEAVEHMMKFLKAPQEEEAFMAAVQGLRTLSGQDFLPEFDLEEPGEGEAEAYLEQWNEWWRTSQSEFKPSVRWRRGAPMSPRVLVADLLRVGTPHREWNYLELRMRYGCPLPLQPRQKYATVMRQLGAIKAWAEQEDEKFQAGRPYLLAAPIS